MAPQCGQVTSPVMLSLKCVLLNLFAVFEVLLKGTAIIVILPFDGVYYTSGPARVKESLDNVIIF